MGLYVDWLGTVASPDRRNPKKQVQDAAHSIDVLKETPRDSQAILSWHMTCGVIDAGEEWMNSLLLGNV